MALKLLRNMFMLFLPVCSIAQGVEVTSENLKSLLEANNPKVSASQLSLEAANAREGYLWRSYLPEISLYGAQEVFKKGTAARKSQPTFGAEAKVNLFKAGRDGIESRIRELETEKRKFGGQKVLAEEVEVARVAYWNILYYLEKSKLLKATIEVNKGSLSSALRRIKSGVATSSDRFEFEMKDVDLRRELSETEIKVAAETRMIALLIGAKGELQFPEALSHDHSYEAVLKHSMGEHEFLFKENEIQGEQASLAASSVRRQWWPSLDAYAGFYQFNEREEEFPTADRRRESVLGLKLSMNLPGGFESGYEATALAKESSAARALAEYQRKEIEAHLAGEMASLKFLHDQVHEAEENIKRAESYYQITQSEYGRGVKNSPDVLGAAEKLFGMRHKRLEIIKEFQIAKAHVLSKIGK